MLDFGMKRILVTIWDSFAVHLHDDCSPPIFQKKSIKVLKPIFGQRKRDVNIIQHRLIVGCSL